MKKILILIGVAGLLATVSVNAVLFPTAPGSQINGASLVNSQAFTNVVASVTTLTRTNVNASVAVPKNSGLTIVADYHGTNAAAAGNVTLEFNLSVDGRKFTTDKPIIFVLALNGTNRVITRTNILAATLANTPFVQLTSITNNAQTNAVFFTNIVWSYFNVP